MCGSPNFLHWNTELARIPISIGKTYGRLMTSQIPSFHNLEFKPFYCYKLRNSEFLFLYWIFICTINYHPSYLFIKYMSQTTISHCMWSISWNNLLISLQTEMSGYNNIIIFGVDQMVRRSNEVWLTINFTVFAVSITKWLMSYV